MPGADPIEVILQVRNLRRFQAEMASAAASVEAMGRASGKHIRDAQIATVAPMKGGAAIATTLNLVKTAGKGTALAFAVAAGEGVKMAINFQDEMLKVHTQAGLASNQVGIMSKKVLEMSRHSTQGPESLARALFHLESVAPGAGKALNSNVKVLEALRGASDLATLSGSELESTTNAIAAAAMVNIPGLRGFKNVVAQLNATAGSGNMRMQDLVTTLSSGVLPVAKRAGLHFRDVGASLAILSDEGIKGYSAGAQLRTSLHYLYAPTKKAEGALKSMGLSAAVIGKVFRDKNQGLPGALKLLKDHLDALPGSAKLQAIHDLASGNASGKYGLQKELAVTNTSAAGKGLMKSAAFKGLTKQQSEEKLGALFPAGRGTVLQVLMNQVDKFSEKQKQMRTIAAHTAESVAKAQQLPANKIRRAWSTLRADLIEFGDTMKGPVADAAVFLGGALGTMLHWVMRTGQHLKTLKKGFEGLPGPIKLIIEFIGILAALLIGWAVITTAAGVGMTIFVSALWLGVFAFRALKFAIIGNPIGAALFVLVTVAILVATHWKQTKHVLAAVWHWIKTAVKDTFGWLMGAVISVIGFIGHHWKQILGIMVAPFTVIPKFIIKHLGTILDFVGSMPGKIGRIATSMWSGLGSGLSSVVTYIGNGFHDILVAAVNAINAILTAYNSTVGKIAGKIDLITVPTRPADAATTPAPHGGPQGTAGPGARAHPSRAAAPPSARHGGPAGRGTGRRIGLPGVSNLEGGVFQPLDVRIPVYLDKVQIAEAVGSHVVDRLARR